ncbi:branched-chain amino acid ABC transporter permease [Paracoccus sp. JM45]|uniref:branched-chain amino acid ABC transporter permease n=1 Tax=Paracoccus sp. JM45 TaxID=2283626 RepID=UPI000E6C4C7B|nr:branched-chain amino acid ABC transporter permease [Paracoccus sp. JM45]RJE79255.1 branched-chain amino acid ABC transporter permease [Paracoccus sp. JM45]
MNAARLPRRVTAALILFTLLAIVPLVLTWMGQGFFSSVVTRMMVYAIAALSLDLILGYGALVSFGHAAFLGIGAYSVLFLSGIGVTDILVQFVIAALAGAVFATITGVIALRTRGVYFIMISLAFGQMLYFFLISLSVFGGDDGSSLGARSTIMGQDWLEHDLVLFYLVLAVLGCCFWGLYRLTGSRSGRVLVGTREDAVRMQAIGFRILPYQLTAYAVSAAICSVAGVLLANQLEYVSPQLASWQRSGELIIMVALGGIGNLTGALAGALFTIGLEEAMARISEHWKLYFGVLLLAVVIFSPGGLSSLAARISRKGRDL